MNVYIKGMEMPKSCNECRFFADAWCYAFEADDWRNAYYKPPEGERRDNCPLVPVPDQGRLIDADTLIISTAVPLDGKPYQYVHIDNIENAPTIIPADKE